MKGSLREKSAVTQLLLLLFIAVISLFVLGFIGTIIVSQMSGISIHELADSSKWDYSKPGIVAFLRGAQIVQFITLFVIPTFLCAYLFSLKPMPYLGLKRSWSWYYFLLAVLIMLFALPLVNWLGLLNKNIKFPPGLENWIREKELDGSRQMTALLSRHTIKDLVINIIVVAGLAGVGEELLFRGMLQKLLIRMFKSPWVGIIVAAIIFSAVHMEFYGFLPRFALGVILGMIYWYSGSLWPAMLAHFFYDALLIVVSYFHPSMINDDDVTPMSNASTIVSAVLVIGIAILMIRLSKTDFRATLSAEEAERDKPFVL